MEVPGESKRKILAITGNNQLLKDNLRDAQLAYEDLEKEHRLQESRVSDLQEALDSLTAGGELTQKLVQKSLQIAELRSKVDTLTMQLQEAANDKRMMDEERQASVEMMSELSKVIRNQQVELKKQNEGGRLSNSEHDSSNNHPSSDKLKALETHRNSLETERNILKKQRDQLKLSVQALKDKNCEREIKSMITLKQMRQQIEDLECDRARKNEEIRSFEKKVAILEEESIAKDDRLRALERKLHLLKSNPDELISPELIVAYPKKLQQPVAAVKQIHISIADKQEEERDDETKIHIEEPIEAFAEKCPVESRVSLDGCSSEGSHYTKGQDETQHETQDETQHETQDETQPEIQDETQDDTVDNHVTDHFESFDRRLQISPCLHKKLDDSLSMRSLCTERQEEAQNDECKLDIGDPLESFGGNIRTELPVERKLVIPPRLQRNFDDCFSAGSLYTEGLEDIQVEESGIDIGDPLESLGVKSATKLPIERKLNIPPRLQNQNLDDGSSLGSLYTEGKEETQDDESDVDIGDPIESLGAKSATELPIERKLNIPSRPQNQNYDDGSSLGSLYTEGQEETQGDESDIDFGDPLESLGVKSASELPIERTINIPPRLQNPNLDDCSSVGSLYTEGPAATLDDEADIDFEELYQSAPSRGSFEAPVTRKPDVSPSRRDFDDDCSSVGSLYLEDEHRHHHTNNTCSDDETQSTKAQTESDEGDWHFFETSPFFETRLAI